MFVRLCLISWKPSARRREREAVQLRLKQLSPSPGSLLIDDLPPNRNGGDMLWRVAFPSRACHDARVARADWQESEAFLDNHIAIEHIDRIAHMSVARADDRPGEPGGLYRVLALAIEPGTAASSVEAFEREMLAMPAYVTSILRWNFARVVESRARRAFTHVWEQEFADMSSFRGDYMDHPYHWGYLDRWFDSDNPARIVDGHLCNSFCAIDRPILLQMARAVALEP